MSVAARSNTLVNRYNATSQTARLQQPQQQQPPPPPPPAPAPAPAPERRPASNLVVRSSRLVAAHQQHVSRLQNQLQSGGAVRGQQQPGGIVGTMLQGANDLTQNLLANTQGGAAARQPAARREAEPEPEMKFLRAEGQQNTSEPGPVGARSTNMPISLGTTGGHRREYTLQNGEVTSRSRQTDSSTMTSDGRTTSSTRVATGANGRQTTTRTTTSTTHTADGTSTHTDRHVSGTGANNQNVSSRTQTTTTTRNRQTETEVRSATIAGNRTNTRNSTSTAEAPEQPSRAQQVRQDMHTETTLTLAEYQRELIRPRSEWTGRLGQAEPLRPDQTGARVEANVLQRRATATATAQVNLQNAQVDLSARVEARVDLVNVNARAQAGDANSLRGQVFAQADAAVTARATAGADVQFDPRNGNARVAGGFSAFAGAEVTARTGYQNRYFGVDAEVRGQAGAGATARAELGFNRGVLRANLDLGAAIGLGGGLRVNVNVNVGAIAQDAAAGARRVAGRALDGAARRMGIDPQRARQAVQQTARRGLELAQRTGVTARNALNASRAAVQRGLQNVSQRGRQAVRQVQQRVQETAQQARHVLSAGWQAGRSLVRNLFW